MKLSKIKKSFLDKLNKILSARDLVLVVNDQRVGFSFLSQDNGRIVSRSWETLDQMFLKNQKYMRVFAFFKMKIIDDTYKGLIIENAHMPYVVFQDLGLMSLETCASFEEMLIHLEVMFPNL